ncbi:MAG: FeoA domain-containing protein [Clostridia bacterium]|nr:FeoA domain-containing protein [Clostridia bacterium]
MLSKRLDSLAAGETARVMSVLGDDSMSQRILDLGFTAGATTRCLYASAAGNPKAYYIRGAIIALRNADANKIAVCEEAVL